MTTWEFIASWFPPSLLLVITLGKNVHWHIYRKTAPPPSVSSEKDLSTGLSRWKTSLLMLALIVPLLWRTLALGIAFADSPRTFQSLATDLVTAIYFALLIVLHVFAFPLRTPLWSALISLVVQAGIDINLLLERKSQGWELLAVLLAIHVLGTLPLDVPREKSDGMAREDSVTLFEWISVSWFTEMISFAHRKGRLEPSDVWPLPAYMHSRSTRAEWESTPQYDKLWKKLLRVNAFDLGISTFISLVQVVISYSSPFFLQKILTQLSSAAAPDKWKLFQYAMWMFLLSLVDIEMNINTAWLLRRGQIRWRTILTGEVMRKSLRRRDLTITSGTGEASDKTDEKKPADHGRIYNLMSGDANSVGGMCQSLMPMVKAPLEALIGLVFLYQLLGWSAFAGFIILPIGSRLTALTVKWYWKYINENNAVLDEKMEVQAELIGSIRQLKWFGWERAFAKKLYAIRDKELHVYAKMFMVNVVAIFFITLTFPGITYVCFLCFVKVAKRDLTIPIAFTALRPMSVISYAFVNFLGIFASVGRLERFFEEEEIETPSKSALDSPQRIEFRNATFSYGKAEDSFTLKDINVAFPQERLSIICGASGSGKTSLMLALLGELLKQEGEVLLPNEQIAYVAQHPWLQHATIRDNILFGSTYDEVRYNSVIEICALQPDLKLLDLKDLTEIGEKGISLSGGQKARVSLARALYSTAKILILDDTLAAVDTGVGAHLVNSFSSDLFKGRTTLLVTHAVDLCLPAASFMVTVSEGRISLVQDISQISSVKDASGELSEVIEKEAAMDKARKHEESDKPDTDDSFDTEERMATPEKLVEEEARAEGQVPWTVYLAYIRAAGYWFWILLLCIYGLREGSRVLQQIFMKIWGEAYGPVQLKSDVATFLYGTNPWGLPDPRQNVNPYLLILLAFDIGFNVMGMIIFAVSRALHLKAVKIIFYDALAKVIGGTFRYFDRTPTGRILNRFSHDFGVLDDDVVVNVGNFINNSVSYIRALVLVIAIVPWFLIVAAVLLFVFRRLSQQYLSASREFRRLESISKSPIYSQFGETLHGLVTIRAFNCQGRFDEEVADKVDVYMKSYNGMWNANRWLLARFDVAGAVSTLIAILLAITSGVSAGFAALVITSAISLSDSTYGLLTSFAELEVNMNCLQRIEELKDIPQEPPAIIEGRRPPAFWPSDRGGIEIEKLEMAYAADLAPVLKGISVSIRAKEKVGIVGRTGSGKSSLTFALLRCVEPRSGKILIDGIDITEIGTEDLRQNLTFIPQEPAIFSGTIRSNLDPLSEHTDEACWEVLRRVHLVSISSPSSGAATPSVTEVSDTTLMGSTSTPDNGDEMKSKRIDIKSLAQKISAGGGNLSAGQKQLLSLARAMLRSCRIIILDEATASVDFETDSKIQEAIRTEFADAIVLTIAHRLQTVIDYDRLLVLANGKVVEFDTPENLLARPDGVFKAMWEMRK
ncbi:P-loop containing nucleoside triphosphate hydrolase protein [Atractiella rhizophila]|nr:P-loop containing nucleoside triphosphate hydrolase protein [Atractiella rhizophila]